MRANFRPATPQETNGTCLQGYLSATYEDLVRAFGEPNGGPGDKTGASWDLADAAGTVVTIYDWKPREPSVHQTRWNVGGDGPEAVDALRAVFGRWAVDYR